MAGGTFKLSTAYSVGPPVVGRYHLRTLLNTGDIAGNTYGAVLYASQVIISGQNNNQGSVFVGGPNVSPTNYGGEILPSGQINENVPVSLDDYLCMAAVQSAPTAPTATNGAAGTNLLTAGNYKWKITFVTADGETEAGTASNQITVDPATELPPALSAIPLGGSSVTARKVYRTIAGGSTYKLVATISDNTTTTYTDNVADASLGATAPTTNTAVPMYVNVFWRVGHGSPLAP